MERDTTWYIVLKYRRPGDEEKHPFAESEYFCVVGLLEVPIVEHLDKERLAAEKFGIPAQYLKVYTKDTSSRADWMKALVLEEMREAAQAAGE